MNRITTLAGNEIFVFGSNTAGIHGAGAARQARESFGAQLGLSFGHTGRCFAIPTCDKNFEALPLNTIRDYVRGGIGAFTQKGLYKPFLTQAAEHPELRYLVTEIGCGLAGYTPEQIAPFFVDSPANVVLPDSFTKVINNIMKDRS